MNGDTKPSESRPEEERSEDEHRDDASDSGPGVAADAEVEVLSRGRTIGFFGGELPVRAAWAIAVYVAVFMVVWMLLWAVLGGLGLAVGWLVAAAVGLLAVRWYTRRRTAP
jgi:Flp pilus assembly protein TadB